MATTLSFGVDGPTQDWTISLNIGDSDAPRILAWLASDASGYGTVTESTMDGDRQVFTTRQATAEEAARNYAEATLRNLLASAVAWEREQAAKAAAEAIPDIEAAK